MVNRIGEIMDGKGTSAWTWSIFDGFACILRIGRNGCGSAGSFMLDIHIAAARTSGPELSRRWHDDGAQDIHKKKQVLEKSLTELTSVGFT